MGSEAQRRKATLERLDTIWRMANRYERNGFLLLLLALSDYFIGLGLLFNGHYKLIGWANMALGAFWFWRSTRATKQAFKLRRQHFDLLDAEMQRLLKAAIAELEAKPDKELKTVV